MRKRFLIGLLCFLVILAGILSNSSDSFPIFVALIMEAFMTIHMSLFVLWPLSDVISPSDSKAMFKKLFVGRILILLFFDFFVSTTIAYIDFFAVFVGHL